MPNDVLIRIQNVRLFLEGTLEKKVREEIQQTLSYVVPNFRFTKKYKADQQKALFGLLEGEPWDGTVSLARRTYGGNCIFKAPTGLFSFVRETLDNNGVSYSVRDERTPLKRSTGYSSSGLTLRDYQEEAVQKGLNKGRGVLKMATGGGKNECVIAMTLRASSFPVVYYVTTCDLLEQAYDRFRKYVRKSGEVAKIGRIGSGHFDIQEITIATIQSVWRSLFPGKVIGKNNKDDYNPDDKTKFDTKQRKQIRELVEDAQFVYADECHHVSATTVQDVLNSSHGARIRIGGSASPWRDDGLDILIEACFGRRFCDISASFLIKAGYLVRPMITFNHFNQNLGQPSTYADVYTNYVVENVTRNEWIAKRTMMHVGMGRPTIILVKFVKHAQILKKLIPEAEILTSSGSSRKTPAKRKKILDKMRNREIMCIIGTTLLDEGVDVPAATTGIFAGSGKSSTRELQRVGRIMRKDPNDPNKSTCFVEEFHDHSNWLSRHAKTRREILKTEREFEITDSRVV